MRTTQGARFKVAALLLILHAVTLIAAYFVLATAFSFPAVLRKPTSEIVVLFREAQGVIVPAYYVFTLSGITFILMSVAMREALFECDSSWGRLSSIVGVLAGLTQAFGFVRWVWLVPMLSSAVHDPAATEVRRETALLVFEAMHQYAGVSVGENLSFWFQGLWTLAVSAAMFSHPRLDRRLALVGMGSGLSFLVYTLEQFGGAFAWLGGLNVVFHAVWLGWMLATASILLRVDVGTSPEQGVVQVGWRTTTMVTMGVMGLLLVAFVML